MLSFATRFTVRTAARLAALAALAGAALLPLEVTAAAAASAAATPNHTKPVYSDAAALGKLMFFDASLSPSGKMSCASYHSPSHAYGPPNGLAAQMGGPDMRSQWYPKDTHGKIDRFNDLPVALHVNADTTDELLARKAGECPVWSERDIDDDAVFLTTLSDGYLLAGRNAQ